MGQVIRRRHDHSRAAQAHDALREAAGNKTQAARKLGVSRQHFYRLLATGALVNQAGVLAFCVLL